MVKRAHRRRRFRRSRGITLVEVIIVMGVISLMVAMVMIGFGAGKSAETSRAVNQIANSIRYGYDKARVTGDYYRMHIDLEHGAFKLQQGSDQMFLPATDRDGEVVEFDEAKAEAQEERDKRAEDAFNRSVQADVFEEVGGSGGAGGPYDPYAAGPRRVPRRRPPLFDAFEDENALSGLADAVKLPEGVKITYVRTDADLKPITAGEAGLYFFPRGRTQVAHIQIEDESGENKYTIKVQPLTGKVDVVDGHEDLVLPDDPNDEEDELGRRKQRRTF